ncbi:MAG: response regulator [Endomicrobiales bacterium]|nr:response regulator [Endomicrobiales bacterium]
MPTKRILVIDDSVSFQETIRAVLSLADFEVIAADNGKEGLEKIYKETPDLIILDCIMPEMDGYEVVRTMREDPVLFNKPVIMLTGKDAEYDEIKGLALGIDDYIVKPFNPALLVARINTILDRKAQSLNANPLTLLCGNIVIKSEIEKRLSTGKVFAMMYIDISNFKSFNDTYGFQKGDEVIKATANILIRSVKEYGEKGDFIGHIGGDDFVILTTNEKFGQIGDNIIKMFDTMAPDCYDPQDRARGYVIALDRNNNEHKYPMMTISIAVIDTSHRKIIHYGQLSEIAAELKKHAKQQGKSSLVVDRRRK